MYLHASSTIITAGTDVFERSVWGWAGDGKQSLWDLDFTDLIVDGDVKIDGEIDGDESDGTTDLSRRYALFLIARAINFRRIWSW